MTTRMTYKDLKQNVKNLKEDLFSFVKKEIIDTIVN